MNVNDVLSTTTINSLVDSFSNIEFQRSVNPLNTRKSKYQSLVSQYGTFSSKIAALKTVTDSLKNSGTDSIFKSKMAVVPDNNYFTATASNGLQKNAFSLRVLQLAKNDIVFSNSMNSTDPIPLSSTQEVLFKTADGQGGEYTSHVSVSLTGTETAQAVIDKLQNSVINDKAEITSNAKIPLDVYSGGDSQFKIIMSGVEHIVNITGASTYDDVLNQTVTQLSGITGLTVAKNETAGVAKITFSLTDNSKDLTITNSSGFDLVADLQIRADKEKAASAIVNLSSFKPEDSKSRLSVSSVKSGVDYRIKEISDINGGTLLSQLGMNFGSTRTQFDQITSPNGSGFLYSDTNTSTNLLNSRFELNGIALQRNSNQVTNAVDGLTLNLKGVMKADEIPINFTTGTDTTAIKSKIDSFISKFNDIYTFTNKPAAEIKSDSNITTILHTLSQSAFSSVSVTPGNVNTLAKIGLSFSPGSGLSVSNSDLLTKVISETPEQIETLFTGTGGIASSLSTKIEPYIGSSGILSKGLSSFNSNISWITDKINSTQKRIDKSAESLRRRYQDLQVQVASLLSSRGYY